MQKMMAQGQAEHHTTSKGFGEREKGRDMFSYII